MLGSPRILSYLVATGVAPSPDRGGHRLINKNVAEREQMRINMPPGKAGMKV